MEDLRQQLEQSINLYGRNDLVTIMISQKLDKEIVKAMKGMISNEGTR